MVHDCFNTQLVYGKQPEQIGSAQKLFQMVLAPYEFDKIQKAFIHFLTHSNQMPTPADIAKLIDGEGKPIMDKSTYIGIKERMKLPTEYIMPKEREYVKEYEKININGYTL